MTLIEISILVNNNKDYALYQIALCLFGYLNLVTLIAS